MQTFAFKNEMLELDGIIRKDITRFLHGNYPLTEALYKGFSDELADAVKDVKKRIFAGAQQHADQTSQRAYILYHQQVLIDLAGRLADYITYVGAAQREKHAEIKSLRHALYEALDDLLDFINTYFANALPADHWLSVDYYTLVAHEVSEGLETLLNTIRTLPLNEELVTIALAPLDKFLHKPTDTDLTYRRQTFIKRFKYELARLYELRGSAITDEDIHTLLFTLNCNSLAYLTYVGRVVRKRIDVLPTIPQKIDTLHQILRDVSQVVQFPDMVFDVQNPPLKNHTMDWIRQELSFWQSIREMPQDAAPRVESLVASEKAHLVYHGLPKSTKYRLKTKLGLSVKQSAFLLRILRETEVIEESELKELLRDLSAIFRSKQREFISANSLYKKYAEVDNSTALSIRNLLLRLAKHVETEYGVR